jgi:hypothetical protein
MIYCSHYTWFHPAWHEDPVQIQIGLLHPTQILTKDLNLFLAQLQTTSTAYYHLFLSWNLKVLACGLETVSIANLAKANNTNYQKLVRMYVKLL